MAHHLPNPIKMFDLTIGYYLSESYFLTDIINFIFDLKNFMKLVKKILVDKTYYFYT